MDKNRLKDQANKFWEKGVYKKAVSLFEEILALDPEGEKGMLLRIAFCYEKMGQKDDAIFNFIQAAKVFAKSGFFLKAIATLKNVLELEPTHSETQELIADLYAKDGKFYNPIQKSTIIQTEKLVSQQETKDNSEKVLTTSKEEIEFVSDDDIIPLEDDYIEEVHEHFTANDIFNMQIVEPAPIIDASSLLVPLPEIPLFSALDRDVFIEVMDKMKLKRYKPGALLIREGDDANAFYIISEGSVRVKKELSDGKEIQLAILGKGDFFGEMAIIGNAKRTASVEAATELEVFELSTLIFDNLMAKYSSVRQTLYKFYKNRLLHNLINTSPIFAGLEPSERISFLKLFKSKQIPPNYNLLQQGGEITGLYIIIDGSVKVYRFLDQTTRQDIATIGRGGVIGEMSLLRGEKPVAFCSTINDTWVLRLMPEDFMALKKGYPKAIEYLNELLSDRIYELDLISKLKLGIY
ncbi:cyclic nucleotide-binding domain-containing protein [bacterium]|nr:cyclic nucleotide-binding domain-containing protein [bacterium]